MYESLANFAQSWGLVGFVLFFIGVIAYAVWPKNKDKFNAAARSVLDENDRPADADTPADTKDDRHG